MKQRDIQLLLFSWFWLSVYAAIELLKPINKMNVLNLHRKCMPR